jgi:hypothetical protein
MILALLVGATSFGVACEKKASTESTKGDAGSRSDKYATADSKLTKALQAAASSAPSAADNGPPPGGIFSPGAADQRHPRGAPSKLEMLSDGAEPRVSLGAGPEVGAGALASSLGPVLLELGLQVGPRVALPTVDLVVLLGASKGAAGEPDGFLGEVKQAVPAKEQMGQLPAEAEHEIATLAGTQVLIKVTGDGRESDATFRLAKAAPADLDRFGELAAQVLALATVPQPPKPVGVGAQWIAETRMAWSGIDVLAYRAFRVKSIEGGRVTLSLDVKAYAANQNTELQGVPKDATLEQFDAQAQGEVEVVRSEVLARKLELEHRTVMVFRSSSAAPSQAGPGGPEGNMLTAQLGGRARMARGEDARAAPRRGGARELR